MGRFKHGWRPSLKDHRNFKYKLTFPQLEVIPPAVDLRSKCSPVENQGDLGSCTAHALAGAFEFSRPEAAPVSRLFIYWNERSIENDVQDDNGASLSSGCKVLLNDGVPPEAEWPYDPASFQLPPNERAYSDALVNRIMSYHSLETLDDMLQCLAGGNPFVFGISVYESFESDAVVKTGIVPRPGSDERLLGGHALLCVGYDQGTKLFTFKNSWGTEWGAEGYGFLSFDYMTQLADDLFTLVQ